VWRKLEMEAVGIPRPPTQASISKALDFSPVMASSTAKEPRVLFVGIQDGRQKFRAADQQSRCFTGLCSALNTISAGVRSGLLTGRFLAEKAKKKRRNGEYNWLFPALLPGPSVVQVQPYIGDKQVKSRSSGDSLFDAGIQAEVTSAFFGSS